jgi:hypothetical protein
MHLPGLPTMQSQVFIVPRLTGGRFEGKAIPLEFLRDLAALNDIIRECAKAEFLKAHPSRRRSPPRFSEDCTLVLSEIGEGSVKPIINILFTMSGFLPNANLHYYEMARDSIGAAIAAVNRGESPTQYLAPRSLEYFKNFGDRLRDGEAIEFPVPHTDVPARFTKEIRRKLLLSIPEVQEVTEEVELRGLVKITNQGDKTFVLKLADGTEVPGSMVGDHHDNIIDATAGYRKGIKLSILGIGVRDRQGKLIGIETIDQSAVLDPLDIHARLDEIRILKDGWLDGMGYAPDPEGIGWLEDSIREHYDGNPLPRIYPVPEGHILFEWTISNKAASLEIDVQTKSGYWHALDLLTKEDEDGQIDLSGAAGWGDLGDRLSKLQGAQG